MAPKRPATKTAIVVSIGAALAVVIALIIASRLNTKKAADVAAPNKYDNLAKGVSALAQARANPLPVPARTCPDGTKPAPGAACELTPECTSCEREHCDSNFAGCGHLKGDERNHCVAVLNCVRATGCAADGVTEKCLCGSASFEQCLQGNGDGPCRAEIENAGRPTAQDGSGRAVQVAEHFFNPNFPLGRALNLVSCDHDNCKSPCRL